MERMGRWIHEALAEPSVSCPGRWDKYARTTGCVQWTTPTPLVPSGGTLLRVLFSSDESTNLDTLAPALRDDDSHTRIDDFVTEEQQMFLELRGA